MNLYAKHVAENVRLLAVHVIFGIQWSFASREIPILATTLLRNLSYPDGDKLSFGVFVLRSDWAILIENSLGILRGYDGRLFPNVIKQSKFLGSYIVSNSDKSRFSPSKVHYN